MKLRQWWQKLCETGGTVVSAHAENGVATVTIIRGRTVQVTQTVRCCRPDCPYAQASTDDERTDEANASD
jgi:hypothetical protein